MLCRFELQNYMAKMDSGICFRALSAGWLSVVLLKHQNINIKYLSGFFFYWKTFYDTTANIEEKLIFACQRL